MNTGNHIDLTALLRDVLPVIEKTSQFIKMHFATVKSEEIIEKSVNSLVSYVDKTAEEILTTGLSPLIKDAGFITEEETIRQDIKKFTWIIDPLDGTTNFLYEIPHFSISVALYDGQRVVLGVVCDVMNNDFYTAIIDHGAFYNGTPIHVSDKKIFQDTIIGTGFTYLPEKITDAHFTVLRAILMQTKGIRRMGSAALDLCYVARGIFGAFYEDNLNAWDIAAGALLVSEAGGQISDYTGNDKWLFEGEILATAPQFNSDMLKVLSHFNN